MESPIFSHVRQRSPAESYAVDSQTVETSEKCFSDEFRRCYNLEYGEQQFSFSTAGDRVPPLEGVQDTSEELPVHIRVGCDSVCQLVALFHFLLYDSHLFLLTHVITYFCFAFD